MTGYIDPKIDCVFKAILGSKENTNLLIHFLNAILELKKGSQIQEIEILNPYNEKEFIGDKLSIVDIKAKDENEKMFQIEIQMAIHDFLSSRIIYNWASIYRSQIREGEDFETLNPVISIWILGGSLFPKIKKCHLEFRFSDIEEKLILSDQAAIHIFQLPKWKNSGNISTEKDRWLCFFKEGKKLDYDQPPKHFQTTEMRQAMKILKRFSERERDALMYQHRCHLQSKETTFQNIAKRAKLALKEKNTALKK
ncbi:MAG: Rpn family recombination-promoting nuclease/putative transposase, partial [Candidatus Magnetomorum sp.]|nr:Rpn family recombination-promoting nuclease/putative transposase [Candidatus Magnetomorum sp.]